MVIRSVQSYIIPSADVHDLRELMQQIISLRDSMTPEAYLELSYLIGKMNQLLPPEQRIEHHHNTPDDPH